MFYVSATFQSGIVSALVSPLLIGWTLFLLLLAFVFQYPTFLIFLSSELGNKYYSRSLSSHPAMKYLSICCVLTCVSRVRFFPKPVCTYYVLCRLLAPPLCLVLEQASWEETLFCIHNMWLGPYSMCSKYWKWVQVHCLIGQNPGQVITLVKDQICWHLILLSPFTKKKYVQYSFGSLWVRHLRVIMLVRVSSY